MTNVHRSDNEEDGFREMMVGADTSILVLGVGNVMMGDEGVGVIATRKLLDEFRFPPGVEIVDGGTGGLSLVPLIRSADRAIIIDAVEAGSKPGSIFMFNSDEVDGHPDAKLTIHDMGILEVLKTASLKGDCPPATIIGVQPGKTDELGAGLSRKVQSSLARVTNIVLDLLVNAGLEPQPREARSTYLQ